MSSKRKNDAMSEGITGREKKKQKTMIARTIAVQSTAKPSNASPGSSRRDTPQASGSKSIQSAVGSKTGLPNTLNVEKFAEARAFEINAMHSAMGATRADTTKRAWQLLPRHLRRRAASHDVRRVPLRLRDKAKAEMDPMRKKALGRQGPKWGKAKTLPRTQQLLKRQRDKTWLETHIWHAKRMHMENMWGYRLAVTPTEKSFRPSHRASVHGSILHDASYYGIVELKGPEQVLKLILDSFCDAQGPSPGSKRFITGARTCETNLYRHGKYPFDFIAPITVLWNPPSTTTNAEIGKKTSSASTGQSDNKGKVNGQANPSASLTRTLWIRVHPSAFQLVHLEIRTATSYALETVNKNPSASPCTVEIADLRGHFNIFEIMGPKSSQVIRGALKPIIEGREDFRQCWNALNNLQTSGSVPRNMVIGFKVHDPRLSFPPKNTKVKVESSNPSLSAAVSFFPSASLAQSEIWDDGVRRPLRKLKFKKKDIDERKSKNLIPGTPLQPTQSDAHIPIFLIQRSLDSTSPTQPNTQRFITPNPALHGWTLMLPAGYSMPFFTSLIHTGTRIGGQRERHSQYFEAGCPSFPHDYPSTEAYKTYTTQKAEEDHAVWARKPPAKRCNWGSVGTRSPWVPDWEVVLSIEKPVGKKGQDGREGRGEDDLIPAQREEMSMSVDEQAEESKRVKRSTIQPWLLDGATLSSVLTTPSISLSPSILFTHINTLRSKRALPHLTLEELDPEEIWKAALVQVRLRMCGRGKVEDLAAIYKIEDKEAERWFSVLRLKQSSGGDDEIKLTAITPSQESIIGYVTSGNFSLSLGEGYAIGAISLSRLLELREQSVRLKLDGLIIKARDRHETICRTAWLEVLEA